MSQTPTCSRPAFSIVIPTLNEVENIDPLLDRVFAALGERATCEVIVVDDGSTDGTRDRVRAWEERADVRLIERDEERGLAGAVMRGAREARSDVVLVMDADLSHPPESIPEIVEPVLQGTADVVIGSRYVRGGRTVGWPWYRYAASRVATCMAWPLVDARDPMAGFFAVSRERLLGANADARGFKILLEVLANGEDDLRIAEVPITFREREHGHTKLGRAVIGAYLHQLIALGGGAMSSKTAVRFGFVGVLGFIVDLGIFEALRQIGGVPLGTAHILSFFVATILNYMLNETWTFRGTGDSSGVTARRYGAFLIVCLAALFLRGGVLASATDLFGISEEAALVLAIGVAAIVNYLGSAFYVFSSPSGGTPSRRWRIAALGIALYAIALRFVYVGTVDLIPEEAYYWNYAQHPDLSYLDHPPMVAWLIGLSTNLFGHTEFAVRLPALMCWGVTAMFAYGLTSRLFNKTAAISVVLLLSIMPFFFAIGMLMTPDVPLTAAWAGALFFLHSALVRRSATAWIGVGVTIGIGMLSKYTIVLLGPPTLLFMLLDRDARRWLFSPWPYVAAAIAGLLFSPVVLWNAQHEWASFAFQSTRRLAAEWDFSLPELVGAVFLLLSPMGALGAINALWSRKLSMDRAVRLFTLLFTLAPLSVFVLFSLSHQAKLNWTGPLWLALLPVVAAGLAGSRVADLSALQRRFHEVGWKLTLVTLVLAFGAGLHFLSLGLPALPFPPNMTFPVAWEELGREVEEIEDALELTTGVELLVVGMDHYFIASELAFYRNMANYARGDVREGSEETMTRHVFNMNGLMYEDWFPSDEQAGNSMILVATRAGSISEQRIGAWFASLGEVKMIPIKKNGQNVTTFYYRIGFEYHTAQILPIEETYHAAAQ